MHDLHINNAEYHTEQMQIATVTTHFVRDLEVLMTASVKDSLLWCDIMWFGG
jgi:hypothetical protein